MKHIKYLIGLTILTQPACGTFDDSSSSGFITANNQLDYALVESKAAVLAEPCSSDIDCIFFQSNFNECRKLTYSVLRSNLEEIKQLDQLVHNDYIKLGLNQTCATDPISQLGVVVPDPFVVCRDKKCDF
ncbi:MAG: hypothetical protein JWQ35_1438 [Bacteriovoracaceae bacterium]|nr:hypothetical protein [Bacteriovoracaceae bacterium]